jgi:hypothetical protein
MPGFDGTGPRSQGPMTGRGQGYCALVLPGAGEESAPRGYAGLQGTPVRLAAPRALPAFGRRFAGRARPVTLRRGRGRRRGRGLGRR